MELKQAQRKISTYMNSTNITQILRENIQTDKLLWDVGMNFDNTTAANKLGTVTAETDIDRIKH